jgi:hypothetical protein
MEGCIRRSWEPIVVSSHAVRQIMSSTLSVNRIRPSAVQVDVGLPVRTVYRCREPLIEETPAA